MDLMHNQLFRIIGGSAQSGYPDGIYRVIATDSICKVVIVACIKQDDPKPTRGVGRPKKLSPKAPPKKSPAPLVGVLLWLDADVLESLELKHCLEVVEDELEAIYFKEVKTVADRDLMLRRTTTMSDFFDPKKVMESIMVHGGLGGLVRDAMKKSGSSRTQVYKLWSLICRYGFSETSLRPRRDKCGAPGILRPCSPGGRKKAGRKTIYQRIARSIGIDLPPKQPGLTTEWRTKILAADAKIKTPIKPAMTARYKTIINSNFVQLYKHENGTLTPVDPKLGEYPSRQQVKWVLTTHYTSIEKLQQATTRGHFDRSQRGLSARNWKGVEGPGHTWAIDSTLGDIYLRSSINRAWIVGRPIVYIIVDVWSTAVVGFYVCLTGPSWSTAKISLFNAASDPALIGDLWGYQAQTCLDPAPSMCHTLMCDRGEYLSKQASITALRLIPCMSYAPPYRPDLKGLVEVLHRITKDAQYLFLPGAMDARRKEFDLRKSRPEESVMTVRDYVQYLAILFQEYNLTANRRHRLDAHMVAQGVFPSPAGLWYWGHAMGLGFRRAIPQSELVTSLLASGTGKVGRTGIVYVGNDYQSPTVNSEQWTTIARNLGSWKIPVTHYPGSVGRIWTPHEGQKNLLELRISDQANASPEVTYDELADVRALQLFNSPEENHQRLLHQLHSLQSANAIKEKAARLTAEAIAAASGSRPSLSEARDMENLVQASPPELPSVSHVEKLDAGARAHEQMMEEILNSSAEGGQ